MQQLIVGRPFPVGQIGVAEQPERRVGVAVGLRLRDDIEVFAEVRRPRGADQTREGENAQRRAWGAAQDGDAGIAQQTEPVQEDAVAAGDRVIVRTRHCFRERGAPRGRRRAPVRTTVAPTSMPPEPVRIVVANMAFGLPSDPEPARIGDRDPRGVEIGRHGERIEDTLQGVRMSAVRASAIVSEPEVVEGRGGAVAPGDADGARLPPYAAEPTASRTIS